MLFFSRIFLGCFFPAGFFWVVFLWFWCCCCFGVFCWVLFGWGFFSGGVATFIDYFWSGFLVGWVLGGFCLVEFLRYLGFFWLLFC